MATSTTITTVAFDRLPIDKRELLIFGYVNDMEKKHKFSTNIPPEVSEIICSFNKYGDAWDQTYMNLDKEEESIELDGNRITATDRSTSTMYGTVSVSSGSYTWRLKIVAIPSDGNFQQPFIGIIKDDPAILKKHVHSTIWEKGNDDEHGYMYCCGTGHIGYQYTWFIIKSCKNEGDILDITLNLDERKIYLTINEEDAIVPDGFENIRLDKYRLVVTIYNAKGTIIELL